MEHLTDLLIRDISIGKHSILTVVSSYYLLYVANAKHFYSSHLHNLKIYQTTIFSKQSLIKINFEIIRKIFILGKILSI